MKSKQKPKSVCQEADEIINGPQREAYGPPEKSFALVAIVWSTLLGTPISARQVALCMISFKALRDLNKPSRDNLVDIAGYAGCAENLK